MINIPEVFFVMIIILTVLITSLVSIFIYRLVCEKSFTEQGKRQGLLELQKEQSAAIEDALAKLKKSEEYKAMLENQYLKGKLDGERETISKFTLSYEPFVEITDSFIRQIATSGYHLQIYYNGLPVGDPTRRETKREEKFKEENLKYMIEQVANVLSIIVANASPVGIPVKVSNKPTISRIKKK